MGKAQLCLEELVMQPGNSQPYTRRDGRSSDRRKQEQRDRSQQTQQESDVRKRVGTDDQRHQEGSQMSEVGQRQRPRGARTKNKPSTQYDVSSGRFVHP